MYRTKILNKKEISEFNANYNVDFYSILIKQENNKYYAIVDCDLKIKIYKREALKYII